MHGGDKRKEEMQLKAFRYLTLVGVMGCMFSGVGKADLLQMITSPPAAVVQ